MGKIRVKTIGDEEAEKQQAEESKKRSEAKRAEKVEAKSEETSVAVATDAPVKKEKKEKFQKSSKQARSKSYQSKADLVDTNKKYTLKEAVGVLPQLKRAKFDETVELHVTFTEGSASGSVVLPHGTGKKTRVTVANGADTAAVDDLVKKIEGGTIDFDVLIATPDAMSKLAKVARVLGPRGLMPNPKNGTVTPKPDEAAAKFAGGQINFKTESKFPLLHVAVGKVSFTEQQITENVKTLIGSLDKKKIKNAAIKSTMSPALRLDITSL